MIDADHEQHSITTNSQVPNKICNASPATPESGQSVTQNYTANGCHQATGSAMTRDDLAAIRTFVAEVERRAEANMLRTHKLEGMHYAAMKEVLAEIEAREQKTAEAPFD
jgi:hypothetical protein